MLAIGEDIKDIVFVRRKPSYEKMASLYITSYTVIPRIGDTVELGNGWGTFHVENVEFRYSQKEIYIYLQ